MLIPWIEKGQIMVYCKFFGFQTNFVGRITLEVAFFDVQNFVPHARYVKTKGVLVLNLLFGPDLIQGQPSAIRKGKLHFVSIEVLLF